MCCMKNYFMWVDSMLKVCWQCEDDIAVMIMMMMMMMCVAVFKFYKSSNINLQRKLC